MEKDFEDLTGQVLAGKYRLDRLLGVGGFGAVYEATHLLGKAKRAVKVIHPKMLSEPKACKLFLKEAQAVMRLQTTRAVLVHDVDRDEKGRLFIVMELIEGKTLKAYLEEAGGRLPPSEVIRFARQICEALQEAHSKGVVHRDLKPQNVMVVLSDSGEANAKVVDFGIARLYSLTNTGETSTELFVGQVGTPPYMSPEQCKGLDVDGRSDLYSLGVMMFEMLTGRLPFISNTPQGFLIMHATEPPPTPSSVLPRISLPAELESLVLRLLAKKPEERPQSALDVIRALDKVGQRAQAKKRAVWPYVASAAVAAMAGLGVLLLKATPSEPGGTEVGLPALEIRQVRDEPTLMPRKDAQPIAPKPVIIEHRPRGQAPKTQARPQGLKTFVESKVQPSLLEDQKPQRHEKISEPEKPPDKPIERPPERAKKEEPKPVKEQVTPRPRRPGAGSSWDAVFDELEREIEKHSPR